MVCTCFLVGVIDLHDLYHLQDLYDLRDFCMNWRICKTWILYTCSHHVYRARVCMRLIFHRFLSKCDLCNLYIFTGLDMYDLQDMYDLPEGNLSVLNDLYIHHNRDAV